MTEYKGYIIAIVPMRGGMREVRAKGKGSVVKALRGMYTSQLEAQKAIDKQEKSKEEKSNGKAKSTD